MNVAVPPPLGHAWLVCPLRPERRGLLSQGPVGGSPAGVGQQCPTVTQPLAGTVPESGEGQGQA